MKRNFGLIFVMGLLALSPGLSQADPTAGKDEVKDFYATLGYQAGPVIGGFTAYGGGIIAHEQRKIVGHAEDALKNEWITYGKNSGDVSGYIPGAGQGEFFRTTFVAPDEKLKNLRREISDLRRKAKEVEDSLYFNHVPSSSVAYHEVRRLRDQADKVTDAMNLRYQSLWDFYKNGARGIYNGKSLSESEMKAISAFRDNEKEIWRKTMKNYIRQEKKKLIAPTLTSIVGLFGGSYAVLKGTEVSNKMEKAKAETQGGSNEVAQPQGVVAAAAR